ncbi:hypothetical protein ACHQM5_030902 [Ranunculus cassubicifolius]
MESGYNTPHSVGNDLKVMELRSMDTSHLSPEVSASLKEIKDAEYLEGSIVNDVGIEGLKLLKRHFRKGSLEKHLKKMAGLTNTSKVKVWAGLKSKIESSKYKGDIVIWTDPFWAKSKNFKLSQSWDDRVKAMDDQALSIKWDKMEAMQESTNGIKKPAAATNNKVHEYREASSSKHNGTMQYSKEEAIVSTNREVHGAVHGAVNWKVLGEDDPHHCDISHRHMGTHHVQASDTEGYTLIGSIGEGPLAAVSLNGLVAQGLVVSGTPDGVLAVHGSPSDGDATTWKQELLEGGKRAPITRVAGKQTRASVCAKVTHGGQSQTMESCQKQSTELKDGSKRSMHEEEPCEANSTAGNLGQDLCGCAHEAATQRQEHGPLGGSMAAPQDPIGANTMQWFGCNISNVWDHNGLGFSALAGPRERPAKKTVVFGSSNGPDGIQMNKAGNASGIQFGTVPMNLGRQRKWDDMIGTNARGKSKLSFIPPSIINGRPVIHVKSEQFEHMHQDYRNSLIGSFIGKKSTFEYVNEITSSEWKTKNYTMRPYGEFSFCFDFKDPNERRAALEMGSLHIASQLFYIQEWKPFIEAELQELKTIPLWVIIHEFPEELRNEKGYSQVASAIGQPMFVDKRTERKETSYARICVEIDTNCAYIDTVQVQIDGAKEFKLQAEYKWKPPTCKICKVFGHNVAQCPKNVNYNGSKEKSAEVLVWKVKQTKSKEGTKANQNGKGKDVGMNHKEEWSIPAKRHSFKTRRAQTSKESGEGTCTPTFTSVFECLRATSEVRMEEVPDSTNPDESNNT